MFNVKLNYFRPSGKWYSSGEYQTTQKHMFDIWEEVKEMLSRNQWPGLVDGERTWYVLIDVPGHDYNHPYLIIPDSVKNMCRGK